MKQRLSLYMKAAFPGIAVQTAEEKRIGADILGAAKEAGKALVQWTATEGMKNVFPGAKAIAKTEDPIAALSQRLGNTVYMFCDLANFPFDRDPILPRALRDLLTWAPSEGSCIIIVGPSFRPHPTLEKLIVVTDYALPSKADLTSIAESIAKSAGKKFNGDAEDVLRALSGLSTTEAENALALSIVESGKFCPEIIYREKVAGVKKSVSRIILDGPHGHLVLACDRSQKILASDMRESPRIAIPRRPYMVTYTLNPKGRPADRYGDWCFFPAGWDKGTLVSRKVTPIRRKK